MAVRHLLLRHRGFESATEGDAFIAAFANPMTALNFCVDLQVRAWDPCVRGCVHLCTCVRLCTRVTNTRRRECIWA